MHSQVGPRSDQGSRWSKSHSREGLRQPGKMQVGLRASTHLLVSRRGLLRVTPVWTGIPVSGSVTAKVHWQWLCSRATWRAMSEITGPKPASSPGASVSPARVSKSTRSSTEPPSPSFPCFPDPQQELEQEIGPELVDRPLLALPL